MFKNGLFQEQLDTLEAMIEGNDKEKFKEWMLIKKKGAKEKEKKKEIERLEKAILKNWDSLQDYRNEVTKYQREHEG